MPLSPEDWRGIQQALPDVRDGLTRIDRIVLYVLQQTQQELRNPNVPTVMLYGRVLEFVQLSEAELTLSLDRLGVTGGGD